MPKRFSMREMALLTLPVLVMGAIGWWSSKRPFHEEERHPQFRVEAPTTLEAFRGADVAFVLDFEGWPTNNQYTFTISPYLQVKTPHGVEVARQNGKIKPRWNAKLWNQTYSSPNSMRYLLRTDAVPAGEVHFGVFGVKEPFAGASSTPGVRPKPLRQSGKWKIDRAKIQPINLVLYPRPPRVRVREVVVTNLHWKKTSTATDRSSIEGEIIFDLQGPGMNSKTPFENSFSYSPELKQVESWGVTQETTPGDPRSRVCFFEFNSNLTAAQLNNLSTAHFNVSGRVSADNRWPLGFQIEPFDFKTAKVGQKLRFKTFPVPLPAP